ncbi:MULTISPECIES: alpha/beta hydrolase [unclassified Pseudomonas]|uniref:esterase/lipase family protein n=1 Tax=unclassified Pseudomonas TaxID=196821 RepID=UPI00244C2A86|nr:MULTISPECIES: alpha/beta hydrolase [unclassified Pseudomonas]MDG9930477.1 alpha/beta hydrolase [Pseudomonas sp. GD04042]MDH0483310.1 alpha/beta hydrolase [Pseudomonas sp. GD04015]MDH0606194.1 alpha/beta hydrolase [Pseudomonas sp. GD03869]
MPEPLVIVHGWSDEPSSFQKLEAFLASNLAVKPVVIKLADWMSMHNEVTFADLAEAMKNAWEQHKLPTAPRSVNIVVHSTGALVVRHWMTRFYQPSTVPIKRFLMLAPANFGSPLAHKGNSFIGRALKGWDEPGFQTGTHILKGLELASPYTFALAERDLFSATPWYGRGRILATVLVGNKGYGGFTGALVDADGSDGTVYFSTANLNCARLQVRLSDKQEVIDEPVLASSKGAIAFGLIAKENHSTITLNKTPGNPLTKQLILRALSVDDGDYPDGDGAFPWQKEIDKHDPDIQQRSDAFQNTVVHLTDDLGHEVKDYFVEFYRHVGQDPLDARLYKKFIHSIHPYKDNTAFRALYLNIKELDKAQRDFAVKELYISLLASPTFSPEKEKEHPVGYLAVPTNELAGLHIPKAQFPEFFKAHRTLLIEVILTRKVSRRVFRLLP